VAFLNRLEILHPAPGERVRIPQWMGERLNEVENFFARRFPGALSTSLMDVANLLEAEADPAYGPAIEHLRRAEQAAFARAFDGAREHYTNALSALAEVWTNTPSD
jgi:hypothetical protein